MNRRGLTLVVLALSAGLVACDEETLTGPGFVCDISNPVRDLFLTPSSALVFVHSPAADTDTVKLAAVATNRFGEVRANTPVSFSSADTTIATVNDQGVVSARRPGSVRITASSCGKSTSALVTVIASVTKVTVTPVSDTVVAGDSATFSARAFGPDGAPVPNVRFTFTTSNSSATVNHTSDSSATIKTSVTTNGTVTVTATGEGVSGTAALLVLPRVFQVGTVANNGLDAGDDQVCGVISAGQLFCWGLNNHTQLGAPTDSICFPGAEPPQTLGGDTVAVTSKPCSLRPLRVGGDVVFSMVSAGDSTNCGLNLQGKPYCWGKGDTGEIGNGQVAGVVVPTPVGTILSFTTITVGGSHVCGLATGGTAYCWGNDFDGQLGDARLIHSTTPIPVSGGGGPAVFASISAGFRHTCALTSGGVAFCWGANNFGQLGAGALFDFSSTPVQVGGGLTFASISAGGDHTCGITTGGAAYCWGSNRDGQLGTGSIGGGATLPTPVSGGLAFTRISASSGSFHINSQTDLPFKPGFGHSCGLTTAGFIYCWGDNQDLQLGRGPFSSFSSGSGTPVRVQGGDLPGNVNFVSVTTGVRQGCGVGTDGAAYCWGSNTYGALGNTLQAAARGLPQRVLTPQ